MARSGGARQRAADLQLMTDATATWERTVQARGTGSSLYQNLPAQACNILGLEKGDTVEVELDLDTGELTVRPVEEG